MSALERPCRIMKCHVRIQALLGAKCQVTGVAPMLSFHSCFMSVKMTFEITDVTKKFATNFTWNSFFHVGMTFEHVQFQVMFGPYSVATFRAHKVFHTRMNKKMLFESFFAFERRRADSWKILAMESLDCQ